MPHPAKAVAQQLEAQLAVRGVKLKHSTILHCVAALYDAPNWNTLAQQPAKRPMSPKKGRAALREKLLAYVNA